MICESCIARSGVNKSAKWPILAAAALMVACDPAAEAPSISPDQALDRPVFEPKAAATLEFALDQPRERSIFAGVVHSFGVDLVAGQLFAIEAEQLVGDVALSLHSPAGDKVVRIDYQDRSQTREVVVFVADVGGDYRLEIEAWNSRNTYRLNLGSRQDPSPRDRAWDLAERTFFEAESLSTTKSLFAARKYSEAAELWQQLGADLREARTRYAIGKSLPSGEAHRARRISAYSRAAELYQRLGVISQQARCLHQLGRIASRSGDLETAEVYYSRSLARWREIGDRHEISVLAFDLAKIERRLRHPQAARRHLREALDVAEHNVSPVLHEARIRTELGAIYQYRGQTRESINELRRALFVLDQPTSDEAKTKAQRARTLTRLGNVLAGLATEKALAEAGELLAQAAELRRDLGEPRGIASTVNSLGLLYEKMNRPREALAAYEQAEELFQTLNDTPNTAVVRGNRCRIVERLGGLETARSCYLEALAELRRVGYKNATAQALFDLAKNARRRNALAEAREWIGEALDIVEAIREESLGSDLRASFLDRKYDYYQLAIDLALELHATHPRAGHSEEAFWLLESARARSFLESMARFQTKRDMPEEVEEVRIALHRAKVESLALEGASDEEVQRLQTKLGVLLERLHMAYPQGQLGEPRILSGREVRQLLDPETVLLEFYLGEQQSAVWAITESGVVWRPLPPRAEIEKVARELYEAMRGGAHRIRNWKLDHLGRELSAMILAPVADLLDRPRLAVVPDGALRYIPFAALPHPGGLAATTGAEPLLLTHQITTTPSASVLAALRSRAAVRRPALDLMALIAAPTVRRVAEESVGDNRLATGGEVSLGRPAPPLDTALLPHAAEEAAAILDLTAGESVHAAIGPAATRDFVFSGALENAEIIHFATHGHLDDRRGELSGLMLAQYDEEGRRIDGYLWAYEIHRLNLAAELVVLSACETALGESIRGEGLVGLTRGFLDAGAQRVLVSLWSVSDRATAQLMKLFYSRLLRDGLEPPEALRQAQIALRASGFAAPYYWAGFVLEGDWQTTPAAAAQRELMRKKTSGL